MTQLIRANELVRGGPFLAPKLTLMIDLMTLHCVWSVCGAFGGRFLGHWCLNFSNWTWFVQCTLMLGLDRTSGGSTNPNIMNFEQPQTKLYTIQKIFLI